MRHLSEFLRKSVQVVPWKFRQHISTLPLIGPAQRLFVKRLIGQNEFLHTVDAGPAKGLRMWIRLPEDKQIWTGTYESDFANVLSSTVRRGDVCLDIGGYHGFFSGVCAIAGAKCVYIFEPLPANRAEIHKLIEANPNLPLALHNLALGAKGGEMDFDVMPEGSMGKLSNSSFQPDHRGVERVRVQVETLDHLIESGTVPLPNIVKIDVEGAEAMVLAGGERALQESRPQLFIEIHSRQLARECSELLARYGYTIKVIETNNAPDFHTEPEVCHFHAVGVTS